ncbi:MAG TPA: hypothetical protein VGH86_01280 [Phenylobacterium sp.]
MAHGEGVLVRQYADDIGVPGDEDHRSAINATLAITDGMSAFEDLDTDRIQLRLVLQNRRKVVYVAINRGH